MSKTLEGCADFDLIVDLTRSTSAQAPRTMFLEKFLELCPKAFNKLKTIVLFQPNVESPRLLMNVYMLFRVMGEHFLVAEYDLSDTQCCRRDGQRSNDRCSDAESAYEARAHGLHETPPRFL